MFDRPQNDVPAAPIPAELRAAGGWPCGCGPAGRRQGSPLQRRPGPCDVLRSVADAGEGRGGQPWSGPSATSLRTGGLGSQLSQGDGVIHPPAHLGSDQGPLPASGTVGVGADCRARRAGWSGSCCSPGAPPCSGSTWCPEASVAEACPLPRAGPGGEASPRPPGGPAGGGAGGHRPAAAVAPRTVSGVWGQACHCFPSLPFRSRNAGGSAVVGMNHSGAGTPEPAAPERLGGTCGGPLAAAALVFLD